MTGTRLKLPGIGSHHSARAISDEWLTPPEILSALGPFDLDPCAPIDHPFWTGTASQFTVADDGLAQDWEGRVWLNPPYSDVGAWDGRLAEHGRGTALVFARTEVRWWFDHVWPRASALLFLRGRLSFYDGKGRPSKTGHNSGGPSVLIAYGDHDADVLEACDLPGAFVSAWRADDTER